MPIGTGLAIGLGAASIGGSVASSAIGAHAAGQAANAQVDAANHAADLQHQDAQAALQFQQQVYGNQQAQQAPWLAAGTSGLVNLSSLLGLPMPQGSVYTPPGTVQPGTAPSAAGMFTQQSPIRPMTGARVGPGAMADLVNAARARSGAINGGAVPINGVGAQTSVPAPGTAAGAVPLSSLVNPALGEFGSLSQPFSEKFVAPTGATEQNDPGYQFRLNEGEKALQNSAAAKGTLLSGATGADIQKYGQDYASNEYGNVYNRSMGEYQNRYNQYNQDQATKFNRLAAVSGVGQTAAGQLSDAG